MRRKNSSYVSVKDKAVPKSCSSLDSQGQLPIDETIVDSFLRIMEDGPRPYKDGKKTNKVNNGADQFDEDHQAAYNSRGKSNADYVKAVDRHNRAYPAMYDELHKRRSIAKPPHKDFYYVAKRISNEINPTKERKGYARRESHQQRSSRTKQRKSRRQRDASRSRRRFRSDRISKRRRLYRKPIYTDKNCQYCYPEEIDADEKYANVTTNNSTTNQQQSQHTSNISVIENNTEDKNPSEISEKKSQTNPYHTACSMRLENLDNPSVHNRFVFRDDKKKSVSEIKSPRSDMDCENPDSNKTSVTAYDSYTSLDHEPMLPK